MIEVILQEAAQHNVSDIHINDTVYFRINKEIYTYQSFQAMQKSLSSVSNTERILPSYKNLQDIANSSQNISQDDFPYQDSISLDIDAIKYELRYIIRCKTFGTSNIDEIERGLQKSQPLPPLSYDGDNECSITIKIGTIKCRISIFRVNEEHCFALRILKTQIPTFHTLQTPQVLEKLSMQPHGLILVCGATGAGKSSTLAAMLHHINTHCNKHILTIEDPIEYEHTPIQCLITQREIGKDSRSFEAALNASLRQDPDVILIGEILDSNVLRHAISHALSGHLVFSSFHANSCSHAISRILAMCKQDTNAHSNLADCLQGIITQRLDATKDGLMADFEVLVANSAVRTLIREDKLNQIDSQISMGKEFGMQHFSKRL